MNKKIIVGITGGIAAYKSCELVRVLKKANWEVKVVMTQAAGAFISPLTLQALSGNPVAETLFNSPTAAMEHIELAKWADCIVIAPASANFIARMTYGHADDLLSSLCLATDAPTIVAPAMNQKMWQNQITQENIAILKNRYYRRSNS